MSNSTQKYKLGTTEIIAFIVAVLIMVGISRTNIYIESSEQNKTVIFVAILTLLASMYGLIIGGLAGFLGVICCSVVAREYILFGDAIAMTVYGTIVGGMAPQYMVREGGFKIKQVMLFISSEATACIVALVFIKPLCDYVFYRMSLIDAVAIGMDDTLVCAIPLNICVAVILYIINIFYKEKN